MRGIHGNPGSRNHPKGNLSPGAWRMEGPENRVTWNLQSPIGPQAPSSQTSNTRKYSTHLTKQTSTWCFKTGRLNSALEPRQEAGTKRHRRWQTKTINHQWVKSERNCRGPLAEKQVSCAEYRAWRYPDDLAVQSQQRWRLGQKRSAPATQSVQAIMQVSFCKFSTYLLSAI